MDCGEARTRLTLDADDSAVVEHLDRCPGCAAHRQRQRRLDGALRGELHWQAPVDLTLLLLAMVPGAQVYLRPKGWYVRLVYGLTLAAVAVSLAVAAQFYGALASQVGLGSALDSLRAAPAVGLSRLYAALPQSRYAVALLLVFRDQLHWLLLALFAWAALDSTRRATAA